MNRRKFLCGVATGVGSLSAPHILAAQTEQCKTLFHPQFGQLMQCAVGLPISQTPTQKCKYWCWAACCEAIFGLAGFKVDQQAFVAKLFHGNMVCQTATGPMIEAAIDGPWTDAFGKSFTANCVVAMDTQFGKTLQQPLALVWNELNAGRAVITGTLNHAVLITALEYIRTPQGPQTTAVIVRDPWPWNPNRRVLSPQEFYSVNFLATLVVS